GGGRRRGGPLEQPGRERARRPPARLSIEADVVEERRRPRRQAVHVVERAPEAQVLLGGELGVDHRLVGEKADLRARRPGRGLPHDLARGRAHQRRQEADEGRLARAVVAEQRRRPPRLEIEAHPGQGPLAPELLDQVADVDRHRGYLRAVFDLSARSSSSWRWTSTSLATSSLRWASKRSGSIFPAARRRSSTT